MADGVCTREPQSNTLRFHTLPAPTPADIATGGTLADDYEGVMVEVQGVALVTANPDDPSDYGEFTVTGNLRIGDDSWLDAELTGRAATNFAFLRGPLHYDYGESKIEPQDAADIQ